MGFTLKLNLRIKTSSQWHQIKIVAFYKLSIRQVYFVHCRLEVEATFLFEFQLNESDIKANHKQLKLI